MIKKKHVTIFGFIILLFFLSGCIFNESPGLTETQQKVVDDLTRQLIPLSFTHSPLEMTDTQMSFLDSIGDAPVIGLGEATHGTSEFCTMKHRIFKYLVEHHGFRIFAIEADFGESLFFDRYITTGEGDLETLMVEKMHFWTWRTHEVRDFIQWMRDYNQGKPPEDQIRYFGVDCAYYTFQPYWLQKYLAPVLPDLWASLEPVLLDLRSVDWEEFQQLPAETIQNFADALDYHIGQVESQEELLTAHYSPYDYMIIRHLLVTARQTVARRESYKTGEDRGIRDRYMAWNTVWLRELFGAGAKIALWAHNGHVARDPFYLLVGNQGYHLKLALGEEYKVIGFGFSVGAFTARWNIGLEDYSPLKEHKIRKTPREDSSNYIFYAMPDSRFILDFAGLSPEGEGCKWLLAAHFFMGAGSIYRDQPGYSRVPLIEHYDQLIYIDDSTATTVIEPERGSIEKF